MDNRSIFQRAMIMLGLGNLLRTASPLTIGMRGPSPYTGHSMQYGWKRNWKARRNAARKAKQ